MPFIQIKREEKLNKLCFPSSNEFSQISVNHNLNGATPSNTLRDHIEPEETIKARSQERQLNPEAEDIEEKMDE